MSIELLEMVFKSARWSDDPRKKVGGVDSRRALGFSVGLMGQGGTVPHFSSRSQRVADLAMLAAKFIKDKFRSSRSQRSSIGQRCMLIKASLDSAIHLV